MSDANEGEPAKAGPKINFAAALGEAGHEVADLGLGNTSDSGTVLRDAGEAQSSEDEASEALGPLTLGALGRVADPSLERHPDADGPRRDEAD